jgi:hypothetical protein
VERRDGIAKTFSPHHPVIALRSIPGFCYVVEIRDYHRNTPPVSALVAKVLYFAK